jgi:hypothetical protein
MCPSPPSLSYDTNRLGRQNLLLDLPSTEFTQQVPERLGVVFGAPAQPLVIPPGATGLRIPGVLWGISKRPVVAIPVTYGSITKTIVFIIDPGSPDNYLGMTVGNLFFLL